jgi:hypothetical protein
LNETDFLGSCLWNDRGLKDTDFATLVKAFATGLAIILCVEEPLIGEGLDLGRSTFFIGFICSVNRLVVS